MQKLTPSFGQPPALTKVCQTSAFYAFWLVARIAIMTMKKKSLLRNVINMLPAISWGRTDAYTCRVPPKISRRGRSFFNIVVPIVVIPPKRIIMRVACHLCGI